MLASYLLVVFSFILSVNAAPWDENSERERARRFVNSFGVSVDADVVTKVEDRYVSVSKELPNIHPFWQLMFSIADADNKDLLAKHDVLMKEGYEGGDSEIKKTGFSWDRDLKMNDTEKRVIWARFHKESQTASSVPFAPNNIWSAWKSSPEAKKPFTSYVAYVLSEQEKTYRELIKSYSQAREQKVIELKESQSALIARLQNLEKYKLSEPVSSDSTTSENELKSLQDLQRVFDQDVIQVESDLTVFEKALSSVHPDINKVFEMTKLSERLAAVKTGYGASLQSLVGAKHTEVRQTEEEKAQKERERKEEELQQQQEEAQQLAQSQAADSVRDALTPVITKLGEASGDDKISAEGKDQMAAKLSSKKDELLDQNKRDNEAVAAKQKKMEGLREIDQKISQVTGTPLQQLTALKKMLREVDAAMGATAQSSATAAVDGDVSSAAAAQAKNAIWTKIRLQLMSAVEQLGGDVSEEKGSKGLKGQTDQVKCERISTAMSSLNLVVELVSQDTSVDVALAAKVCEVLTRAHKKLSAAWAADKNKSSEAASLGKKMVESLQKKFTTGDIKSKLGTLTIHFGSLAGAIK